MLSTIQFNFALDKGRLEVLLEADLEHNTQDSVYLVKNFRIYGHQVAGVLPEIRIKKPMAVGSTRTAAGKPN